MLHDNEKKSEWKKHTEKKQHNINYKIICNEISS